MDASSTVRVKKIRANAGSRSYETGDKSFDLNVEGAARAMAFDADELR